MKVNDVLKAIDSFAPFSMAYGWDNSGLLAGGGEREVRRIFITLDTNVNTVREAAENGCDLIVSHHPIFFSPVKRINCAAPEGEMIELLMKHDISVIAAHTNMDCAARGINRELAERFGLKDIRIIEPREGYEGCGLGRCGKLAEPMTLTELARETKRILGVPALRIAGDNGAVISSLAVAGGSCSEIIPLARRLGCQAVVTGDMKYHETIDNVNEGICIIDPGHYGTEHCVLELFEGILRPLGAELVFSRGEDVFRFI